MKNIHGLCNIKKLHKKGNQLIIDGYSTSEKILSDKKFTEKFLKELTAKIKMTPISKPLVISYKSKTDNKEQNGITGTILLAESNITIHTYPNFKFFCLDIFSCKEFPIENTMDYLIKRLQIIKYKKKLLKRGFYDGRN